MAIYGPSPQDEGVMDGAWGWGDMVLEYGRIRRGGYRTCTGTHKRELQKHHHVSGALVLFFCRKYCHMSPSHNVTVRQTSDYRARRQFCSVSRPIPCSHLTHFLRQLASEVMMCFFLFHPAAILVHVLTMCGGGQAG